MGKYINQKEKNDALRAKASEAVNEQSFKNAEKYQCPPSKEIALFIKNVAEKNKAASKPIISKYEELCSNFLNMGVSFI